MRLYGKSEVALQQLKGRLLILNMEYVRDQRIRILKEEAKQAEENLRKGIEQADAWRDALVRGDEAREASRAEVFKEAVQQQEQLEQLREQEKADRIAHERDVALATLEMQQSMGDLNVQQKAALEEQKYQIEVEYAEKAAALEVEKLRKAYHAQYARIELLVRTGDLTIEEGYQKMAAAEQVFRENAAKIGTTLERDIAKKRIDTTTQTNEMIYQDYRQTFERIRSSASSLLDQLFSRTKSWGDMLKSILQAAILTPLKEIAAEMIAITWTGGRGAPARSGRRSFFWELFNLGNQGGPSTVIYDDWGSGTRSRSAEATAVMRDVVSYGTYGRTGGSRTMQGLNWISALGRLFRRGPTGAAALPAGNARLANLVYMDAAMRAGAPFGLTGAAGLPLGAGRLGGLVLQDAAMRAGVSLPTAGTPAFGASLAPMAAMAAALGGISLGASGIQRGGLLGGLMGVGGLALAGTSISMLAKLAPLAKMAPWLAKLGGWAGAGVGAGIGLTAAGWQRGGALGALMAIGGGALAGGIIGSKIAPGIGTVVGTAIGAAIGGIGSLVGSLRKSAEEKMIEEVRSVYGITVSKDIAKQFLQIAKDRYAGDLRMAVRSPEIRELVKLYALSTGQRANVPRSMYPVEMAQTRGGLNLMPVYESGNIVASPYVGPTPSTWNPGAVYVQLDPNQANQLLEGRVVKVIGDNPEAISQANTQATQSGTNRNAGRVASMEPLTTFA